MAHEPQKKTLEDWFIDSPKGWLIPKYQLSGDDPYFAVGLKDNQINLIKESSRVGGQDLQKTIQEQKILSSERLAALVALRENLPWLPWTRMQTIPALREVAHSGLYATAESVPIFISEDRIVHYLISDLSLINKLKLMFKAEYDYSGVSFLISTPKTIAILYYRYFTNERKAVLDTLAKAEDDATQWLAGFGHLLTECVYQEGGVENIYFEPGPHVGQVFIQVEGIRRHLHSFSIGHEPNGSLSGTYGRIINLIAKELVANERELSVPGRLPVSALPSNLVGKFDFRVELKKTIHGWAAVLRPFDLQADIADLDLLGFDPHTRERLTSMIESPYGLLLIVGPTSSGKNTTAISLLYSTDAISRSIQTIEHPVEVKVALWQQHQIPITAVAPGEIDEAQRTYTNSLLRSAPQIIYWGESRNADALYRALTAANTGHLTLSTYHAQDNAAGVLRMRNEKTRAGDAIDMATTQDLLIGILSQRLLRKVCPHCSVPENRDHVLKALQDQELPTAQARQAGDGCDYCNHTRYSGRTLAYELFEPDDDIDLRTADRRQIRSRMKHSLYESGLQRLAQGLTTFDELNRVLMGDRLS